MNWKWLHNVLEDNLKILKKYQYSFKDKLFKLARFNFISEEKGNTYVITQWICYVWVQFFYCMLDTIGNEHSTLMTWGALFLISH